MRQAFLRYPLSARRRSISKTVVTLAIVSAALFIAIDTLDTANSIFPSGPTSRSNGGDLPRVLNGGQAWNGGKNQTFGQTRVVGQTRTPSPAMLGKAMTGRVWHVRDGDTVEVGGQPIRLANLDCAEKGTMAGDRATRRMKALVGGKRLACSLTGRKSYDRWVGSCHLKDGRKISDVMISEGLCRRWK